MAKRGRTKFEKICYIEVQVIDDGFEIGEKNVLFKESK